MAPHGMDDIARHVENLLRERLDPLHLEIRDDSALHAGHPGATSGGAHLHALVVASSFEGKTLLEQHRLVYDCLGDLLGGRVHALGLKTVPASRWER